MFPIIFVNNKDPKESLYVFEAIQGHCYAINRTTGEFKIVKIFELQNSYTAAVLYTPSRFIKSIKEVETPQAPKNIEKVEDDFPELKEFAIEVEDNGQREV